MPAASASVGGLRRFVDISVPRNIAASVNELEGEARVFNVDDLKEVRSRKRLAQALARPRAVQKVARFWSTDVQALTRASSSVVPLYPPATCIEDGGAMDRRDSSVRALSRCCLDAGGVQEQARAAEGGAGG